MRRPSAARWLAIVLVLCAALLHPASTGPEHAIAAPSSALGVDGATDRTGTAHLASACPPESSGAACPSGDEGAVHGKRPLDHLALCLPVGDGRFESSCLCGSAGLAGAVLADLTGLGVPGVCSAFGAVAALDGTGVGTPSDPVAGIAATDRTMTLDGSESTTGGSSPMAQDSGAGGGGTLGSGMVAPVGNAWEAGSSTWGMNVTPGVLAASQAFVVPPSVPTAVAGSLSSPLVVQGADILGTQILQPDPQWVADASPVLLPGTAALIAVGGLGMATALRRRVRRPVP